MKTPLFCPVCDERVSDGTPSTDPTDELNATLAEHEDEALVICPRCGSAIECSEPECNHADPSADGDAIAILAASPIGPLPAEDEDMQTFAEPEAVTRPEDAIHDSQADDGAGIEEAIDAEAIDAESSDTESSDAEASSETNDLPSDDIRDEGMELELDEEPAALPESSEWGGEEDHDAESELETVRENFEDTDIEPPSANRRDEELDAEAGLDWGSVPVASRPRRPERSWLMKFLPPVLGGLTAIPIAIAILWYGFGKDIGGAGPQVARFAPWIVPKHLRGRPYYDSNTSAPSRRNAVTRPPASKPFRWPTPSDAERGDDSNSDRGADNDKKPTPLPDVFPDSTDASEPPASDASESTEPSTSGASDDSQPSPQSSDVDNSPQPDSPARDDLNRND